MKTAFLAAAFATVSTCVLADADTYLLDPSHSQVVFSYNHLGFSTTHGMFSGFNGEIQFDQENPAASSVAVSFPVKSMLTGWEARFAHFMNPDFFAAKEGDMISFVSTGIEVTGDNTAVITGDLTMNGVTRSVELNAKLNQAGNHPSEGKPWAGFDATTSLLRSDYDLGKFAPYVSDEVAVNISIEAMKAE